MGLTNQNAPSRMTTMGPREGSAPVCAQCHERKEGQIYFRNVNGDFVCEDCTSPRQKSVLGACGPDCKCEDPTSDG